MRVRLKRWLFLTHRWLGVGLCAVFAMWFVSGVVMMYVGYPRLTSAERLAHLPPLGDGAGLLGPREALERAGIAGPLRELRLAAARAGQPVYLAVPEAPAATAPAGRRRPSPGAGTVVIDARSGQRLHEADAATAVASAAAFGGAFLADTPKPRHVGLVQEDAFTHSRALDAHRPLHVLQLDDAEDTRLYVSSLTGEVVRDATRTERVWNYVGAWIHWLYLFRGGVLDGWWTDIVNWLSIAGIVLVLAGMTVGLMRWRFGRPYKSGARSPYGSRAMRWHHIGGLLFGAVTLTWIFSGLMSMNPWRIFDTGAAALRTQALGGVPLQPMAGDATPAALLAVAGAGTRELRWTPVLGVLVVQANGAVGRPTLLKAADASAYTVEEGELQAAIAGLLSAPLLRIERLQAYDFHYYDRAAHTMTGGAERPLPVLRAVFGDAQHSWVHIDPATGTVLGRSDSGRRTSRWLFALLHSWDWLPLLDRRPLWDVLLVALSLGAVVVSLTGVVIGWRRLGLKVRARRRRQPGLAAVGKPFRTSSGR